MHGGPRRRSSRLFHSLTGWCRGGPVSRVFEILLCIAGWSSVMGAASVPGKVEDEGAPQVTNSGRPASERRPSCFCLALRCHASPDKELSGSLYMRLLSCSGVTLTSEMRSVQSDAAKAVKNPQSR